MTEELEFVCLANSKRDGGRCIAGLRTSDWLTWVRPITDAGPLPESVCQGFGPLDVVRVSVTGACPDRYQPENWKLATNSVRRIRSLAPIEALRVLRAGLTKRPMLLGSTGDSVPVQQFASRPADSSLAIVEPEELEWRVEAWQHKVRASFKVGGSKYELPVTDPNWRSLFAGDLAGSVFETPLRDGERLFLTVSLGAPFNGKCYKLVAAVIVVPAARG